MAVLALTSVFRLNILFQQLCLLASLLCPPSLDSEDVEEHHTQIPEDLGITDFGPLPRERYPLVAVLTLAEQEDGDEYIVSPPQIQPFSSCACLIVFESDDHTKMGFILAKHSTKM